jgi:fibronectin-binding autotransporter adhesin
MGLEEGADALTAGAIDGSGIWARIEAAHGHFEPETSTSSSDYDTAIWRLQAGLSMVLTENAGGSLLGGLSFTYGSISADVESPSGIGSIDSTGYGIGGTLTWYGSAGFYVDGQAQVIWYDSDLFSKTANTLAADSNDGTGYALSIEAGKKFAFAPNWSITPQAQLAWSSVDFQSFTDPFDADVSLDESDSLIGRLGMTVDYESFGQDGQGRMTRAHVYSIGNLYYDFADGSTVDVGGTRLTSANEELWGGLGIGGAFNRADDKYSVYGEAQAKTGLENFGDSHVLGATVGFRASW